jgi:hypothetical protein
MATTFIANQAGIAALLNSEEGPVAKMLGRKAVIVESQAKLNATGIGVVGARNPEGRGPRVRTDRLRGSITWVYGHDQIGLFAAVGTNVYYGRILEVEGVRTKNGGRRYYPFLKPALNAI